jgi:hypothetical protein
MNIDENEVRATLIYVRNNIPYGLAEPIVNTLVKWLKDAEKPDLKDVKDV